MKRLARLLAASLLLLAVHAGAQPIVIDPGEAGSSFDRVEVLFNDLNGTSLVGQAFDLDFEFSDSKRLDVTIPTDWQLRTELRIRTAGSGENLGGGSISPEPNFLSDENGDPLIQADFASGGSAEAGVVQISGWGVGNDGSPIDLVFHGLHYSFSVNNFSAPGRTISEVTLVLCAQPDSGPPCEEAGTRFTVLPEPSRALAGVTSWIALAGLSRAAARGRTRRPASSCPT